MLKVLYICTHNRCRSILCEALTNHLASRKMIAKSAGSHPVDTVHPLSLKHLAEQNIPTDGLKSQSWDELEDFQPDLVVTVCDDAAGEVCPAYISRAVKVHWSLRDPSKVEGSPDDIDAAFRHTMDEINNRVQSLVAISAETLTGADLKQALLKLGAIPG